MRMKLTEIVNSTFGRVAALISVGTFTYFTSDDVLAQKAGSKPNPIKPAIIINDDGTIKFPQETYKVILKFKEPQTDDEKFVYKNNDIVTYMNWVRTKYNIRFAKAFSQAINVTEPSSLIDLFKELERLDETGTYMPLEDMRTYQKSLDTIKISRDPTKPIPKPVFYQEDSLRRLIPITKTNIEGIVLQKNQKQGETKKSEQSSGTAALGKDDAFVKAFDFSLRRFVETPSYKTTKSDPDGDFYVNGYGLILGVNENNVLQNESKKFNKELSDLKAFHSQKNWKPEEFLKDYKKLAKKYAASLDSLTLPKIENINEKSGEIGPGLVYFIKSRDGNGFGIIKILNCSDEKEFCTVPLRFEWKYYPEKNK